MRDIGPDMGTMEYLQPGEAAGQAVPDIVTAFRNTIPPV
jgi:hypothetical protein